MSEEQTAAEPGGLTEEALIDAKTKTEAATAANPAYQPLNEDELKALIKAKREQLKAHTEAHNQFAQQSQATLNESLKTALKIEGSIICLEELLAPKEEKDA